MKKVIVIVFAILTVQLFANSQTLISCGTDVKLFRAEKADVFYLSSEKAVLKVSQEDLTKAQNRFRDVQILENWHESDVYYIISHPNEKVIFRNEFGSNIFEDDRIVIARAESIPVDLLHKYSYSFTELKKIILPKQDKHFKKEFSANSRDDIQNIVNQINPDSVAAVIQGLQDFETRFCYAPNRDLVASWLENRFQQYGISETVVDSFFYNGVYHKNVVGILPGTLYPDKFIVIGGHHDSVNNHGDPYISAPGADDNASACAATLEIARVMVEQNYQPYHTILFMTFAAEEVGLVGSWVMAQTLAYQEMDVRLMINNDMIANNPMSPDEWEVRVIQYVGYEYLADYSWNLMEQYTSLHQGTLQTNSSSSDAWSFYSYGFPPIYYFEEIFSPYYHSSDDIIDNCDIPYATEVVKLNAAMLSSYDKMPIEVDEFFAYDSGDGNSILLNWEATVPPNFSHFLIGYGNESENYTEYTETTGSSFEISNLQEGSEYYFGVAVVNDEDFASFFVEISATPNTIPAQPQQISANPQPNHIFLQWVENSELDLEGYHLYRTAELNGTMELIWSGEDADYTDENTESGVFYYYQVTAVDEDSNESEPSEIVRGRIISLDHGILLVDDTRNGNGNFLSPTQEQSDAFNQAILSGFAHEKIDTEEMDLIRLDDLCAYSTVLWFVYDASNMSQAGQLSSVFSDYLDYGGQLLISAIKPSFIFGSANSYPFEFSEDSFAYEYLGISESYMNNASRFRYAVPTDNEYSQMEIDPEKTIAALENHILNVESIVPNSLASSIFEYGSDYDNYSPFGEMNGMPVSVIRDDGLYKSAVFSTPLYYFHETQAQNLIYTLLTSYFNEPTDSDETTIPEPSEYSLKNFPNPFNPETTITFTLPESQNIKVEVFNLKGQKVITLIDAEFTAGRHSIVWNGIANDKQSVSSGIYFCRLLAGKKSITKKIMLLK